MPNTVEIENIERMRRCAGIDDAELRRDIRELRVGCRVRVTLLHEGGSSETVLVRITSIGPDSFRGKLAEAPTSQAFSQLPAGSRLVFTGSHIHSIPSRRPENEH
jgi:hypothetical protein